MVTIALFLHSVGLPLETRVPETWLRVDQFVTARQSFLMFLYLGFQFLMSFSVAVYCNLIPNVCSMGLINETSVAKKNIITFYGSRPKPGVELTKKLPVT